MRANEFLAEAKVSVKDQILQAARKNGGDMDDYFVRFSKVDKLGYSAKQWFGRSPDADHPKFDADYIGSGVGKPALWFYPLKFYLAERDPYGTEQPNAWLVKLRPDAWLQPMKIGQKGIQQPPAGKERVGLIRLTSTPAAIFFKPAFDVVGQFYDYGSMHKRHGQVKGKPVHKPTFFDRVRGHA